MEPIHIIRNRGADAGIVPTENPVSTRNREHPFALETASRNLPHADRTRNNLTALGFFKFLKTERSIQAAGYLTPG